ncbi:ankyrin repeat and sterile alpha motif domain-containing protein 1B-like isoform X2 [Tachypleus tridentatus]|uniref:ankyrin repeat and sterile alpha motif domain-containing protein 1B-like isoform X2 n=1 Tax=Tachypleus tridentatus TaxID=6853 RepID=UPI003FD4BC21
MGKEQELLEAARNGNLSVVERILNQRARKSGPLASLRRGPGANTQDPSGYTSLHHSALNGHKDIVSLLLTHEASTNVVDNKGSTPLHLAAWTGNTEIVKLLLVHGPSVPNVNHTNHDHETALHSAAQYGHTDVVSLLLQNNCDPTVRNFKEETALDLAAQYGRLETVEQLIKYSPQLLRNNIKKHSPLHLASRNGHKQVVKTLLDAGFDFNFLTEGGSALHEAAFYGKNEVVKHLLDNGVDVNLQDQHGRTVFDLLEDLNTNIAKKTLKIVKDHVTLVATDDEVTVSPCSLSPPPGFLSGTYGNVLLPERLSSHCVTSLQQSSSPVSDINFYEVPPPPRSFSSSKRSSGATDSYQTPPFCKSHDSSLDKTPSSSSRSPSIYETPPPPRQVDILAVSSAYQLTPKPWIQSSRISRSSDSEAVLYEVPPPGKRFSDPIEQNSTLQVARQDSSGALSSRSSSTSSYVPITPQQPSTGKPQPPAKPPRRSIVTISPGSRPQSVRPGSSYEYLSFVTNTNDQAPPLWTEETCGKDQVVKHMSSGEEYADVKFGKSVVENHEKRDMVSANSGDKQKLIEEESGRTERYLNGNGVKDYESDFTEMSFSALYDDIASGRVTTFGTIRASSKSTTALPQSKMSTSSNDTLSREDSMSAKPNFLDFRNKRATVHIPLSPTNYHQPPTPDFPPPSPATAEYGILEKIRPLSQEYQISKRASRDIATLTDDDEIFATVDSRGYIEVTLQTRHQSVSTDNIEEVIDDDPFAGLCRGSVCPENSSDDFKISFHVRSPKRPSPPSRKPPIPRKSQNIHENIGIEMEGIEKSSVVSESSTDGKIDNQNSLSVMSPFDENAEWAEIANIMASFGSGIAQESVFTSEMEEHFTNVLSLDNKASEIKKFKTVEEWLTYLGLSYYENLFISNGFDDMEFMGGNIVEDRDLKNIGISNKEERERILKYCKMLQSIQSIGKDKERIRISESVKQWLKSLHLEVYYDILQKNGYTDMERVLKISVVELNMVLGINKIGHQKRILASLQERSSEYYIGELEDFDLLKLYLGSTLVKELKGLESTRKSIQKLKLSARGIVKAPNVLLSISYTGVKFIDGRSKQKVCEHEIQNIHCACQDAEDLTHFAYITKEHQTNFHYCHVFCAESMGLATEVILTLGQAFEVAYQMALRDKTKTAQKCEQALNKCHDCKLAEKDRKNESSADNNLVQQGEKEHKTVSEKTT